ncbi:Gfo/Idh/MocA family protein [Streptomyces alkaliphilus]|uniref:Gfo/Idh/MocA family protein n=1 Tax=Streptomyces alkaliphilus TaxID=1472722 RepID=UPI00117F5DB7|nr:Gfo/Idh/MocA family oxidoreductase [Streptomyces alkaliphilus]MQS06088.1 gfo/Idh/MocA family oxidoreductase [Streptomyces alkaliphilus]
MQTTGTPLSPVPIRWGILATGGIAESFTRDLARMPDAEVVAVGSRNPESARRFAERHGIARAHGSWKELAADDGVDVVYVATPHSAHADATTACLEAGRAVLCEKPFTVTEAQARGLVELARSRDLFLMEAMWTYCHPLVRRMGALIADGAIGEVRSVQADFGLAGPFPPGHRLLDPALAGGALLDLGVYPVSFAHLVLGEPDEVLASADVRGGVDVNTAVLLRWGSGALATLGCSLTAETPTWAAVTGTKGRIEFPRGFFVPSEFSLHRAGREPERFTAPDPEAGYTHQAAEVMRALRAGETESPLVPHESSLAVMRTLDRVRERIGLRYPGE